MKLVDRSLREFCAHLKKISVSERLQNVHLLQATMSRKFEKVNNLRALLFTGVESFLVMIFMKNRTALTVSSSTLFALAKQSKNLGAYKMARTAYDKLQVCKNCGIVPCRCKILDNVYFQSFTKLPRGFEVIVR